MSDDDYIVSEGGILVPRPRPSEDDPSPSESVRYVARMGYRMPVFISEDAPPSLTPPPPEWQPLLTGGDVTIREDDDGLPTNLWFPSRACIYCQRQIGEEHGPECVIVEREVHFDVAIEGGGRGVYVEWMPASWSSEFCEFRCNEGSWCANNMHCGGYTGDPLPESAEDVEECICGQVHLTVRWMGSERRVKRRELE